jgi:holo-[acyl-carrier protein] synthase
MPLLQGIDMVEIERIKAMMERHRDFLSDLFTEREAKFCNASHRPAASFASCFAAKEAALKALGIGMSGSGIDGALREIEVMPGGSEIGFSGWIERIAQKKGISGSRLTLSADGGYAVAAVVLFG